MKNAVAILNIKIKEAIRVPSPNKISREQMNSANTFNTNEASCPSPIGLANCISSAPNKISNFGNPWVSINTATPILKIRSPASILGRFKLVE